VATGVTIYGAALVVGVTFLLQGVTWGILWGEACHEEDMEAHLLTT
jgi:hypothetical protein